MGTLAQTIPGALRTPWAQGPQTLDPPAHDHTPSSQMTAFARVLGAAARRDFAGHADLHAFSVAEFRVFWGEFLQWCRGPLGISGDADPVCVGDSCEHAQFFPQLRLNFADSLLNLEVAGADAPAVRECHADGASRALTRGELRAQVAALAQQLAALGVQPGDRVAAVMRNDARAVAFALAVVALGATLSTAAPDMGLQALLDRFEPLQPKVLAAHLAAHPSDAGVPLADKVAALAERIGGLQFLVRLDEGTLPGGASLATHGFDELARGDPGAFDWPRFAFNHPLFVMFSSGTTGRPKCIVHGAGGSLLEHVKEHRLHTDLRPGERMYFHTSCGWMMWNWQLSALASGVEIVTYDGPIDAVDRLWQLVAREQVAVFGTSPGYLKMCEEAAVEPAALGLGALRAVLSTGAVLHDAQFRWLRAHAKDVPVQSISGGTDILGCFVLGHPDLPVHEGEAQCRSLALDVQAWQDGRPVEGTAGHLVCANPFPSRPLGFFGDDDGSQFHAAYFAQNPGVWTHGDLIEISAHGGARMHGRADGVINVRGTKFWPGEIYRVLAGIPGIVDAMVVERRRDEPQVVALLVLAPGVTLDAELASRVRRDIGTALSAAHVPDLVLDVPALPVTHNGKASEAAARSAVNGVAPSNLQALRNPECLRAIADHPGLQAPAAAPAANVDLSLTGRLASLWARHFGLAQIGPDDNFFELGGNSLLATRLLRDVRALTGCTLPLSALLQAPTVARLAAMVEAQAPQPSPVLACLRDGQGAPLFLVHGVSGTVMECWSMVQALRTGRPVWGLQAPGVDGEAPPPRLVEELAAAYVANIRTLQHHGPYAICGHSFGGLVAYEMARQIAEAGDTVDPLVLLDPYLHGTLGMPTRILEALQRMARMPVGKAWAYLRTRIARMAGPPRRPSDGYNLPPAQARVWDALVGAMGQYRPLPYAGPVLLVHALDKLPGHPNPVPAWRGLVGDRLRVVELPGEHMDLVGIHARRVAAFLDEGLGAVRG
ncbi:MAG: acetoacetate--CoA ligase [Ramlibacter sp.]